MATLFRPSVTSTLNLTATLVPVLDATEKHQAWMRWIYTSINTHFQNNKGTLPMYFEGDERTLQDEAEFYELRIDGPSILQTQKGFYFLDIEVNVLVQAHMDDKKLYNLQTAVGPIIKAFENTICIYRYGDGNFDDDSLLGVMHLRRQLDETIAVNNFGIIKEDSRLQQTTIEGHYRMEI